MKNLDSIKVDTGRKKYLIKDLSGKELGTFWFNPSDFDIVRRYNETIPEIEKVMTMNTENEEESLVELEDVLEEKLDYLFGADVSSTFFAISGPLTPMKTGELFVEQVVNVLASIVEKELNVKVKKLKRVAD